MNSNIGAGARVYMGSAATPNGSWNGGASNNAALVDVTEYLSGFNIATPEATVDVTKLNVDTEEFFRKFIAGLNTWTGSANYGEDKAGTFFRRAFAIRAGILHERGRSKVDVILRPFGDGSGKLQVRGTVIITDVPLNTEVEAEVGGSIPFQGDGPLVAELQA